MTNPVEGPLFGLSVMQEFHFLGQILEGKGLGLVPDAEQLGVVFHIPSFAALNLSIGVRRDNLTRTIQYDHDGQFDNLELLAQVIFNGRRAGGETQVGHVPKQILEFHQTTIAGNVNPFHFMRFRREFEKVRQEGIKIPTGGLPLGTKQEQNQITILDGTIGGALDKFLIGNQNFAQ